MLFNKTKVKEKLNTQQIFEIVEELGGEPIYTNFGFTATTICHNPPGEGSRKLYYYENSTLFQCFSNCGSFDIFQLIIKALKIQENKDYNLNDAVKYVAFKFSLFDDVETEIEQTDDWKLFEHWNNIQNLELKNYNVTLKQYDSSILDNFNYTVPIYDWLDEGIKEQSLRKARIGFLPSSSQITIPHFDMDSRLVGIRIRALEEEDIQKYGKYRPLFLNRETFSHPLGFNLYNLNKSKEAIKYFKKAIVFESEKSCLLYDTLMDNDISVACCGSNFSVIQEHLLLNLGVNEIIIAFDRQFKELNDDEFKLWVKKLKRINEKFGKDVLISFVFDKHYLTHYKDAPIEHGKSTFIQLFKERIIL